MTTLEIGRNGKAHGLRGEVTVVITSDRPERTAPGAVWHLSAGPVTVTAIRPFQQRWIAVLEGVTTREAAEALSGQVIYGDPIDDPDALWVHDLVGADRQHGDGTGVEEPHRPGRSALGAVRGDDDRDLATEAVGLAHSADLEVGHGRRFG
jgi:ribosomal 30S subunit maturation factor RimM